MIAVSTACLTSDAFTSRHAQGVADALILIHDPHVLALNRFLLHVAEPSCSKTHAYLAGFRTVIDTHLAHAEKRTLRADELWENLASLGDVEVFREGDEWAFYIGTERVLAYAVPQSTAHVIQLNSRRKS